MSRRTRVLTRQHQTKEIKQQCLMFSDCDDGTTVSHRHILTHIPPQKFSTRIPLACLAMRKTIIIIRLMDFVSPPSKGKHTSWAAAKLLLCLCQPGQSHLRRNNCLEESSELDEARRRMRIAVDAFKRSYAR